MNRKKKGIFSALAVLVLAAVLSLSGLSAQISAAEEGEGLGKVGTESMDLSDVYSMLSGEELSSSEGNFACWWIIGETTDSAYYLQPAILEQEADGVFAWTDCQIMEDVNSGDFINFYFYDEDGLYKLGGALDYSSLGIAAFVLQESVPSEDLSTFGGVNSATTVAAFYWDTDIEWDIVAATVTGVSELAEDLYSLDITFIDTPVNPVYPIILYDENVHVLGMYTSKGNCLCLSPDCTVFGSESSSSSGSGSGDEEPATTPAVEETAAPTEEETAAPTEEETVAPEEETTGTNGRDGRTNTEPETEEETMVTEMDETGHAVQWPVVLVIVVVVVLVLLVVAFLLYRNGRRKKQAAPAPSAAPASAPAPGPIPVPAQAFSEEEDDTAPAVVPGSDSGGRITAVTGLVGVMEGRTYPLGPEGLTFGRDPSSNICFPADVKGVSRKHCSLFKGADGGFMLMDCGSTYGTFLQGVGKLSPDQPYPVKKGDTFYLGSEKNGFMLK